MSLIGSGVSAIDEELKQLGISYADKKQSLVESKRKKGGNLLSAELNDVLTEDHMRRITVHDTEYLKTLFIAVPKGIQENFESNVYFLGKNIVGYGGKFLLYRSCVVPAILV